MKRSLFFILSTLLLAPFYVGAVTLQRQGIFDCNPNGAYAMSVGAMSATGGVYVPVADATVELNTGILVYKECILREVINREREAATAGTAQTAVKAIQTGRRTDDGRDVPLHVVNRKNERVEVSDGAFVGVLKDGTLDSLNPALRQPITKALARKYEVETRKISSTLGCSFKGDLKAFQQGTLPFNFADFLAGSEPQCDPAIAQFLAEDIANQRIAQALANQDAEWDWGNGYYARTDGAQDPLQRKILTPAINVQQSFQTILDSPVRQMESANDIGQMINALYAGMTTHILSDSQGLAGITKSFGGQPSYLAQVVSQAAEGLRTSAVNTAIANLNAARDTEVKYFQTANAMGAVYTQAIAALRSIESQCWKDKVIPAVCGSALASDNTCTAKVVCAPDPSDPTAPPICPTGPTLKIATSTAFSQSVIDAEIVPGATEVVSLINASQNALRLIEQLIAGVTNASLNAQQLAIVQLNNLVAQKLLHTPPDVNDPTNGIVKRLDNLQAALLGTDSGLVASILKLWADSPSVRPGWCNVNNPAVIEAWKSCWNKNSPNAATCPKP